MPKLTRKGDSNTSDPDPYSYPPSSTNLATPASEYPGYNDSTDHLAANSFIGRDEAVPGGRNRPTYPPTNDDYAYEKGLNPVTRGSIAAQVSPWPLTRARADPPFGVRSSLTLSSRSGDRWQQRDRFPRRKA